MTELDRVIGVLSALRTPQAAQEAELQQAVEECLRENGISFLREAVLGPRARIDFLTEGGVGIELKKGRPDSRSLKNQLERYAEHEKVHALVVVTQKSASVPAKVKGKLCVQISLNRLWGVAL